MGGLGTFLLVMAIISALYAIAWWFVNGRN